MLDSLPEKQHTHYWDNLCECREGTAEAEDVPVPVAGPRVEEEVGQSYCCTCVCYSGWHRVKETWLNQGNKALMCKDTPPQNNNNKKQLIALFKQTPL